MRTNARRRRWAILIVSLLALFGIMILAIDAEQSSTFSQRGIPEEQGKKNAAATATGRALAERHGADLRFLALERHGVEDYDLIGRIFPEFPQGAIGCVIVATAGGDGAVFVEDPELRIIHEEPLSAFVERTRDLDPALVAAFYLSLG